jgi:hypothetical protein
MRELRAAEKAATEKIAEYRAFGMSDEFIQRYSDDLDDVLAEMRSETVPRDYVPDRMPVGSNAPAGPDEGCSTGWSDLAETLDQRADDAAIHPWFAANPHWSYRMHDENVDLENLKGS